jgi:hypothetical protein
MTRITWILALGSTWMVLPGAATAQTPGPLQVAGARAEGFGPWGLLLSVNDDDDDENRRMDDRQSPPAAVDDDVRTITLAPPAGTASIMLEATGAERIRVHANGALVTLPGSVDPAVGSLQVDGVRASAATADVVLRVKFLDAAGNPLEQPELAMTVVGVAFLDAQNAFIDPTRLSLQFSHAITNDDTLPRENGPAITSSDPENFRVEAYLATVEGAIVSLRSAHPRDTAPRVELGPLPMVGPAGVAARSPFIRLVADTMDWTAPGVLAQVLRADLRDRVSAVVAAPDGQTVSTDLRVGRPGNEDGPEAVRLAHWNIHFLRLYPGGPLAVGVDEETALKIARDQVVASNEIYAVCNVTFGDPRDTNVDLVDPPGPTLLAVADIDGLSSAGGEVRFTVDGTAIGPIIVGRDWPPHQTAAAIAAALEAAGFRARVSENAPVDYGAGRSADVLVLSAENMPVRIEAQADQPLTTDLRQTVTIGSLDLTDRLTEFNNATSSAGTLEERVMYKVLGDDDPATIDLFVINRFAGGGRQGEAFIEHDRGMIRNALILDRTGISQTRQAWTQSHEAGHVLLDDPYHPDNFGPDRPWLLMDADASLGAVEGPKRLTKEECERLHSESGLGASPPLVERWDVLPAENLLEPEDVPVDPGYPRP